MIRCHNTVIRCHRVISFPPYGILWGVFCQLVFRSCWFTMWQAALKSYYSCFSIHNVLAGVPFRLSCDIWLRLVWGWSKPDRTSRVSWVQSPISTRTGQPGPSSKTWLVGLFGTLVRILPRMGGMPNLRPWDEMDGKLKYVLTHARPYRCLGWKVIFKYPERKYVLDETKYFYSNTINIILGYQVSNILID